MPLRGWDLLDVGARQTFRLEILNFLAKIQVYAEICMSLGAGALTSVLHPQPEKRLSALAIIQRLYQQTIIGWGKLFRTMRFRLAFVGSLISQGKRLKQLSKSPFPTMPSGAYLNESLITFAHYLLNASTKFLTRV